MSRVTAAEVKEVIETEVTDSVVEAYILYAATIVDDYLSDSSLTASALKEIERYLTAHAISVSTARQAIGQEVGPVKQKFSDIFGTGFNSSTYGQMAMSLDSTGTLAELSSTKKRPVIKAVKETHEFRYQKN